jgi:hypothetical protein
VSSTTHTELTGKETVSDFEKLLDLAEELKDKCENTKRRADLFRLFEVIVIALIGLLVLFKFLNSSPISFESSTARLIFATTLIYSIVVALVFEVKIRQIRLKLLPDRKALAEVVSLLREVESVESKSPLERAYFRIRLSRFDIGY